MSRKNRPVPSSSQPESRFNERESIQYLMGNPPTWMMRYGISTVALFFSLAFCLGYFIRYPDMVDAKVTLVTAHPPIRVMATNGGRVTQLNVQDNQVVKEGEVLAVLENTADWQDVLALEAWLQTARPDNDTPPVALQLGELQSDYSAFTQHWNDLQYYTRFNGVKEKTEYLLHQIAQIEAINGNMDAQAAILREEFNLSGKELQRQQQLHSESVIADSDLEKTKTGYLQQKRQLESTKAIGLQNQMQIKQLQSLINDLQQEKSDKLAEKGLTISEDTRRLSSAINAWKQKFLVTAPIGGKVSYTKVWSVQQYVGAGEEMLAVVPADTGGGIIGKAVLPANDLGKVASGQRALIRIDGLPVQEFGTLEARVTHIALVPQKEEYHLDLQIPNGFVSTYGKSLLFRQEMTGSARIVTEDRRLLSRIFGQVRRLLAGQEG